MSTMVSPGAPGLERLMASPLTDEIEFLAARARALGAPIMNEGLRAHGLRERSYSVLTLASGGLAPTQRHLAEFLCLDPSQIVSLVDDLERAGLVRREPDPGDRRSKIIVATDEGERVRAAAAVDVAAAEKKALAGLTDAERDQLRTLLAKAAFRPD